MRTIRATIRNRHRKVIRGEWLEAEEAYPGPCLRLWWAGSFPPDFYPLIARLIQSSERGQPPPPRQIDTRFFAAIPSDFHQNFRRPWPWWLPEVDADRVRPEDEFILLQTKLEPKDNAVPETTKGPLVMSFRTEGKMHYWRGLPLEDDYHKWDINLHLIFRESAIREGPYLHLGEQKVYAKSPYS